MSLLLQLVDHLGHDLSAEVLRDCRTGTRPLDIASICNSIERIISSLSSKVIVVLVMDGVKFFAYPAERRDQMRRLVEALVAIYRTKTAATLKFLFASPTRSEFLEDFFEDDETLTLSRDLPRSTIDTVRDRLQLQLPTSELSDGDLGEDASAHDTESQDDDSESHG
jgi:hypothetical protein